MLSQKNEVLNILSFALAADQGKRWCGGDIFFYRRILFLFFSSVEFMNQFDVENPSCHNKAGAIQFNWWGRSVFFSQPEGPLSQVLEQPEAR